MRHTAFCHLDFLCYALAILGTAPSSLTFARRIAAELRYDRSNLRQDSGLKPYYGAVRTALEVS